MTSPTSLEQQAIEVTQADRDAAASLIKKWGGDGFRRGHHIGIQRGDGDSSAIVQAFARHRIAHTPQPPHQNVGKEGQSRAEILEDAAKVAAQHAETREKILGDGDGLPGDEYDDGIEMAQRIAAAIQALSNSGGGGD